MTVREMLIARIISISLIVAGTLGFTGFVVWDEIMWSGEINKITICFLVIIGCLAGVFIIKILRLGA